jgi:DNA-binding PadR family transcriptional regulator
LADGPGFGLQLIERAASRSRGLLRLNCGGVYGELRGLERDGMVRAWIRRMGRSGRPRRYYELTPEGILHVERLRSALRELIEPRPVPSPGVVVEMSERLERGTALYESAIQIRDAGRRAGLR